MSDSSYLTSINFYDDENIRKNIIKRAENISKDIIKRIEEKSFEEQIITKLEEFDKFKRIEGSFIQAKKHILKNCKFKLSADIASRTL
jgi:hypothetical protein